MALQAIADLRALGIRRIEVLTGDNDMGARRWALHWAYPVAPTCRRRDKLAAVGEYQACGHTVAMVGDANDAPHWPRRTWGSPWAQRGRL